MFILTMFMTYARIILQTYNFPLYGHYKNDNWNFSDELAKFLNTVKENIGEASGGQHYHGSGLIIFYTLVSLYGFFIVLGVLGNCLIMSAVLLRENMRTARNVFIVTLAISDIFLCIVAMPSTLWEVSLKNFQIIL